MSEECDFCVDTKHVYLYDKISLENKLLKSILEKNDIILEQNNIINNLLSLLKIHLTELEFEKLSLKVKKIF